MKLLITVLVSSLLFVTSILAGPKVKGSGIDIGGTDIHDNPQISATLATNTPFAGAVLVSDGSMNYWGSAVNGVTVTWNESTSNNAYVGSGANIFITFNTNFPVADLSQWALYPAVTNLDMGRIYSITNIERVQVYDSLGIGQNILPVTNKMASLTIYQQTNDSEAIRLHGVDTGSVVLRGYTGNTEGFRMYPWGTIYFMDLDAEIVHFKAGGDLNIGALGGTDPAGTIFKSKYGWTASANTTIYNTKHADSFAPTTGNARHYSLWLNDTINQTGSSSGNTYGIVIDPILTSASNYVAMDVRKGNVYVSNSVRASTSITIGSDNSLLTNDVHALTIIPRTGQPALSLRASSDSKNLIDFYDASGNYRLFMNNSGCLYYQENGWIFGGNNKRLIIGGYGDSSVFGVEAGACWTLSPSKGVPRWAFKTAATFNPTAGNVDYYGLWIGDTINQAGSSGTTYGIVIDPTLTAASNYVAMDVRKGNVYVSNSLIADKFYGDGSNITNLSLESGTNWSKHIALTNLDMNGFSITNIGTNSLKFENGTILSESDVQKLNIIITNAVVKDQPVEMAASFTNTVGIWSTFNTTNLVLWDFTTYIISIDSIVTQVVVSGEGVDPEGVLGVYPFIGLNANDTEIFNNGTYQISCPLAWDPQYTLTKPPYEAGNDELFMSRSMDRNPSSIYDPKDEFSATGTPTVVRSVITNMITTTNLAIWSIGSLPNSSNSFGIFCNGTNVFGIISGDGLPYIMLQSNSKVCFGTSTNYIADLNGTNFMFRAGTNWATFDW